MSQVTELASGQINSACSMTIELVQADDPGSRHRQIAGQAIRVAPSPILKRDRRLR
jgi:hypothetical protein